MNNLNEVAIKLQQDLGCVDMLSERRRSSNGLELLIVKLQNLKLKIYEEPGHALPHIHVDYGKIPHAASYSIYPPARLVGQLDKKYDRAVTAWIARSQETLLALWQTLQTGGNPDSLLTVLEENT